ncbi:MAG: hypothetical protein LBI59_02925, partial [Candidatus Accumulibacter sp.]|nr:hypothetical protein [Accumulibacter sp.]
VVRTFPSVPIDNETLGKVIDRYLVEEKRGTLPIGLYREISRALQAEAAVEIDRLDWTGAGSGDMASEGAGATAENTESIVVRGRLRLGVKATPRQRLAAFDRFVEALRAGEKLRVEVLQPPLDIASGTALRADISPEEEEKPREFELRVIREIEP